MLWGMMLMTLKGVFYLKVIRKNKKFASHPSQHPWAVRDLWPGSSAKVLVPFLVLWFRTVHF